MNSENHIDQPSPKNGSGKSRFFLTRGSSFKQIGEDLLSLNSFKFNKSNNSRNDLDSRSEMGLKIGNYKLPSLGSIYRTHKKGRSNSINLNSSITDDDKLQIDGVKFFISDSNGICGSLKLNKKSLLFQSGIAESQTENVTSPSKKEIVLKNTNPNPKSPINEELNFVSFEIDYLNIGDVDKEVLSDNFVIIIYCRNFKHVKFLIKQSAEAVLLIDKLVILSKGIFDSSVSLHPCLWHYLFNTYSHSKISDWIHHEKWYFDNARMRFSIFNEIGQCETLPIAIIVPSAIAENKLDSILTISNGHRVPVVTYLYRKSGHLLIRSTSFQDTNLQTLLDGFKAPLRELDVESILPSFIDIQKYYAKLRKACFTVAKLNNSSRLSAFYDMNQSKRFMSKCGPWLISVSKVLKFTASLTKIIKEEASIGLVETFDRHWNCVLSSLVQIIVDPHRRTMLGFDTLISKEWLYLNGYKTRTESRNGIYAPNESMFHIFIDCVHQLIVQNPTAFEFSTFYLLTLIDSEFTSETFTREKSKQLEANKQHIINFNPFYYNSEIDPILRPNITDLRLFYGLFFRQLRSDINKYTPEEYLLLNQLQINK